MTEHKSMLCVGGPRAGERYAVMQGSGFTVPVRGVTGADNPASRDYQPNKPAATEVHAYREEVFHTPQGDVSMWVPKDQTPLETITALLAAYENMHSRSKR